MKVNLNTLLDERNLQLWNLLKKKYSIEIFISPEPNYVLKIYPKKFLRKKKAVIFIQLTNLSKDAFTHELLHLYLDYNEIKIYEDLTFYIGRKLQLHILLNNNLRSSISNFLEHSIILLIYLDYGFDRTKFLNDYNTKKADIRIIESIEKQLNNFTEKIFGFQNYLGIYFSIKCCPNSNFDYDKELIYLNDIEPNLYKICDKFWNNWSEVIIEKRYNNIAKIMYDFIEEIFSRVQEERIFL